MNALTIDKALQLYLILQPHLPEKINDDKPLEFIGTIVRNIKASDKHRDYVEAIALMMDTDVRTVIDNLSPEEALLSFIEGLSFNQITLLKSFGEQLGL